MRIAHVVKITHVPLSSAQVARRNSNNHDVEFDIMRRAGLNNVFGNLRGDPTIYDGKQLGRELLKDLRTDPLLQSLTDRLCGPVDGTSIMFVVFFCSGRRNFSALMMCTCIVTRAHRVVISSVHVNLSFVLLLSSYSPSDVPATVAVPGPEV